MCGPEENFFLLWTSVLDELIGVMLASSVSMKHSPQIDFSTLSLAFMLFPYTCMPHLLMYGLS